MTPMAGTEVVGVLDWGLFDDPRRLAAVEAIDERRASQSSSLRAATRLAALVAGAEFAQVSLIGNSQFVAAAHGGLDSGPEHSPSQESLCGVTMASGTTLTVEDARTHPWVSDLPPVRSGAVAAYLGTPLITPDGLILGAICVYDTSPRQWSATVQAALRDCAELVSTELELLRDADVAMSQAQRLRSAISEIVKIPQHARVQGMRSAVSYRPRASAPVGGDWVDLFPLCPESLAVSIGDVAGSGIGAVATMDRLRNALRAHIFDCSDPGEALTRCDRLITATTPGAFATCLQGVLDTRDRTLRFASSGHLPPLLLRGATADYLPVQPGPPIGAGVRDPVTVAHASLIAGDRLLFVTDGVIERRTEDLDTGLHRLAETAQQLSHLPLDRFADTVMDQLVGEEAGDDACLLALEVT